MSSVEEIFDAAGFVGVVARIGVGLALQRHVEEWVLKKYWGNATIDWL